MYKSQIINRDQKYIYENELPIAWSSWIIGSMFSVNNELGK